MKRFSTVARGTALALIVAAAAGIVVANMADVSVVGSDYLVRANLEVAPQSQSASSNVAEVATLTDWEYTLRTRPVKCQFFNP